MYLKSDLDELQGTLVIKYTENTFKIINCMRMIQSFTEHPVIISPSTSVTVTGVIVKCQTISENNLQELSYSFNNRYSVKWSSIQ